MSLPKCKVEIYKGANLTYSLTEEVSVHIKDVLNGVGTFNFFVPTLKGTPSQGYKYLDIVGGDKAKFYFWYADITSCPATPQFVGRISKPTGTLTDGYARIFEGKLHSEILQRRIQPAQYWSATDADVIIAEIISDLGIGSDITADATHVTVYSQNDTYLDLMKKLSDHWVSSGVQLKKDFYVDAGDVGHPNGHLIWKPRPLRTVGVETLTVGSNIKNYTVLNGDVETVKNNITAYGYQGRIGIPGHEGRCQPSDKDGWTEATTGWTKDIGGVLSAVAFGKVGTNNLAVTSALDGGIHKTKIRRTVDIETYGDGAYQTLNFYDDQIFGLVTTHEVRLYAPDNSNYFYASFICNDPWQWNQIQLGQNQEYNVDTNPTAPWYTSGTPNWTRISEICFYTDNAGAHTMYYDGLYFGHGRFRNTASNGASITAYQQRDMQMVDDSLLSDAECQTRAETLLYQLKDPPKRIDIETKGNTNIKIGDQLLLTIPAENISASPYDIITVTHDFADGKLATVASTVNSNLDPTLINVRTLPCGVVNENIEKRFDLGRDIARGLRIIR